MNPDRDIESISRRMKERTRRPLIEPCLADVPPAARRLLSVAGATLLLAGAGLLAAAIAGLMELPESLPLFTASAIVGSGGAVCFIAAVCGGARGIPGEPEESALDTARPSPAARGVNLPD